LGYEEQRKIEKERIEIELRELREKQQMRRKERDQEEKEYAQRMRESDEKRRAEEDANRSRLEEQKRQRAEERLKKQAMMQGAALGGAGGEGLNFVVNKAEVSSLFGAPEKKARGPSKEQIAEMKKVHMASIQRKRPTVSDMLPNDLKDAIKRLHATIMKMEGERYDLEQRTHRQEYDLKELHERELQNQRNKALKAGIDPVEAGNLKHPPKVLTASKFDRQVDRRTYVDKRVLFEEELPFVPPPPPVVRGSCRPPPEWGRKKNIAIMDELEQIRKNLEPPKYVEQAPIEGAKPPMDPIPLQVPDEADVPAKPSKKAGKAKAAQPEPEAAPEVEAEA